MKDELVGFSKYLYHAGLSHQDYQYDGVRWILANELAANPVCGVRGGFIADEMGLGKTIMMIGTFLSNLKRRTLVVVPPVLNEGLPVADDDIPPLIDIVSEPEDPDPVLEEDPDASQALASDEAAILLARIVA